MIQGKSKKSLNIFYETHSVPQVLRNIHKTSNDIENIANMLFLIQTTKTNANITSDKVFGLSPDMNTNLN